jgi:hypothetical protein
MFYICSIVRNGAPESSASSLILLAAAIFRGLNTGILLPERSMPDRHDDTQPPERARLSLLGLAFGLTLVAGMPAARACLREAAECLSPEGRRFLGEMNTLFGRLDRREITAAEFVTDVGTRLAEIDLEAAVGRDRIDALRPGGHDFLLGADRPLPARAVKIRLVRQDEIAPPHGHHNQATVQCLLRGRLSLREYDKVGRADPETLLLRPVARQEVKPGGVIAAAERRRNVHWFASDTPVSVILSVKAIGDVGWTLDPPDSRRVGRFYVAPAADPGENGLIAARQVDQQMARRLYGARHPESFPWPGSA